jgi:hypothetical protein
MKTEVMTIANRLRFQASRQTISPEHPMMLQAADYIDELLECIRVTKKDIQFSASELERDLKLFETR